MTAQAYDGQVTRETPEHTSDDTRWTAVLGRDTTQDGRFVYAVASTKIYCRPSCPSRRPARRQVRFYTDPAAAEAAGYRACRRCEPATSGPTEATRRVLEARAYIDAHPDEPVTLEQLSRIIGLSPHHLQRSFKRVMGLSPLAYASARRLERLKEQLRGGATVTRAAYEAGYGSGNRAYDQTDRLGMTPATYRRGGRGARIRYIVIPTSVGRLLVAATDRGLCSVTLGDDGDALAARLRSEFPAATIVEGDADLELAAWAREIAASIDGNTAANLPLDVPATAFQWQVWERLRRIPRGSRRSYSAIAAELGQPSGARAVARACASNPVALVIPCHRVLREDGALGGYRWGIERKQQLLDRERRAE
jgi:AraC family transcriptional regulator of adaptative response/methylated-DNA-[protein]-cysteine methyltransferase